MTRKKVKLAYITNDSARKATFKKRKKGLLKKVSELSTLCGIKSCAIIYSPYDSQPEVWASEHGIQHVLGLFKNMPEMEQTKKMVNQESFLKQRIAKANEQLKKQQKDNREKEMTEVMFQSLTGKSLHNLTMMDLNDLGWLIDQNLKNIYRRIGQLNKVAQKQVQGEPAAAKTEGTMVGSTSTSTTPSEMNNVQQPHDHHQRTPGFEMNMDTMQRQQWFMDMMNLPQENNMGFGGDEMMLPFGDNSHNALWSNAFFP
ncbi:agamous-like MADS-box protein AGL80 [Castanea sativa]|uniref:agamous-like MADS-box protein AGL80 n=1 Tax=Castanea sativa TaxID=21020 RepID=UPI003F64FFE4